MSKITTISIVIDGDLANRTSFVVRTAGVNDVLEAISNVICQSGEVVEEDEERVIK